MVEVPAGYGRGSVVTRCEPRLRAKRLFHVIACTWTAHLRRNPAGLERIRENVGPPASDAEGQEQIVQLAVRIGLEPVPRPGFPCKIFEARITVFVKALTNIDEALRLVNECRQDIRGEAVDRKDVR